MLAAITPQELKKDFALPDSIIRSINVTLKEKYDGRGYVIYYGTGVIPNPMSYLYVELIKKYYSDAGWVVNYTSDQRDGCYLTFKAKS